MGTQPTWRMASSAQRLAFLARRAERLGFIPSADDWMTMRKLRNQMIHEHLENPIVLADALEADHRYVPVLVDVTARLRAEIERRGWAT